MGISHNEKTKVHIVAVRAIDNTAPNEINAEPKKANIALLETKPPKPFIQVGIFGVQNNANKTNNQMLKLNLPVNIFEFQIKEKPYWRVVVGPANTLDSRKKMLKAIKSAGFTDAYYVSN